MGGDKKNVNAMRRLGAFVWFGYRIPIPDRARLLREIGFETVLHWWDDSFLDVESFTKAQQAEILRKNGLIIENAHLRMDRVNSLWMDTPDGQSAFDGYLADIDGLAAHNIPCAVMHTANGPAVPPATAIGMQRFLALADRAARRGVRLALENVRNPQRTADILDAVDSPSLGLCYDSGHDLLWSETPYALLERYKERLFAVHLHDNRGEKDDHLAPGEGKVDWETVRRGIEASAYTGSYTLESDSAQIPAERTARKHLKMHFDGARAALFGGAVSKGQSR